MSTFSNIEMRGKTVRVMTCNGFSIRGRVADFDQEHQNIVLDCCDAQCAVVPSDDKAKSLLRVVTDPPHIGPAHSEVFIRGSSIRWIEIAASALSK